MNSVCFNPTNQCCSQSYFEDKKKPSLLTTVCKATLNTANTLALRPFTWCIKKVITPRLSQIETAFFARAVHASWTTLDSASKCIATETAAKIFNPITPAAPEINTLWKGNIVDTCHNLTDYLATEAKKTAAFVSAKTLSSLGILKTLDQEIQDGVFQNPLLNQSIASSFQSCVEENLTAKTSFDPCIETLKDLSDPSLIDRARNWTSDLMKSYSSTQCTQYTADVNFAGSEFSMIMYIGAFVIGLELLASISSFLSGAIEKQCNSTKIEKQLETLKDLVEKLKENNPKAVALPLDPTKAQNDEGVVEDFLTEEESGVLDNLLDQQLPKTCEAV